MRDDFRHLDLNNLNKSGQRGDQRAADAEIDAILGDAYGNGGAQLQPVSVEELCRPEPFLLEEDFKNTFTQRRDVGKTLFGTAR